MLNNKKLLLISTFCRASLSSRGPLLEKFLNFFVSLADMKMRSSLKILVNFRILRSMCFRTIVYLSGPKVAYFKLMLHQTIFSDDLLQYDVATKFSVMH